MPDYTQPCSSIGSHLCRFNEACIVDPDCDVLPDTCSFACSPPLANSHLTGNTCVVGYTPCVCIKSVCTQEGGSEWCTISGDCEYDCDPGFVWNGVACVPVAPAAQPIMDGFYFLSLLMRHPIKTLRTRLGIFPKRKLTAKKLGGGCVPCVKKFQDKYEAHGFNEDKAKKMAIKLYDRVQKRLMHEAHASKH